MEYADWARPRMSFKLAVTNYDFSTTLNKVLGRHELSFGWDSQKQFMNVGQTLTPDGFYQFEPDATSNNGVAGGGAGNGDAFASFLLGVGTLTQGQPIATPNGTLNPWFNQGPNLAGNCGAGAPKNINAWLTIHVCRSPQICSRRGPPDLSCLEFARTERAIWIFRSPSTSSSANKGIWRYAPQPPT